MEKEKKVLLSEDNLIYCVAGQLFQQAPNKQPRNIEKIMVEVRDKFRKVADNVGEWYSLNIEESKIYKFVDDLMCSIPEFVNLNLSHIEYNNGVKVGDESRGKFKFCSAYDVHNSDSWKDDFIDLDAFVQNVDLAIKNKIKD